MGFEQLSFDFAAKALTAQLCDRRRRPTGPGAGAARLLTAMVKGGLNESALLPAAGLALELDRQARDQKGAT